MRSGFLFVFGINAMNRITVSEGLITQLGGFTQPVELCDAEGHMVGHFVPAEEGTSESGVAEDCPYSAEELDRMRGEEGGRGLSEIWDSLGAS